MNDISKTFANTPNLVSWHAGAEALTTGGPEMMSSGAFAAAVKEYEYDTATDLDDDEDCPEPDGV